MKRLLTTALLVLTAFCFAAAQRMTDKLDRGLVAVKTDGGVFCSWRILAEEYYDVTYNIYRDGTKLNAEPLTVSCFTDAAGSEGSKYTVSAVVRGKEQPQSKESAVWGQGWLEITPDHGDLTSTFVPNDACMADVDGDGRLEILMKFDNQSEISASYPKNGNNGEYSIAEVMKLDGTRLWWLDFGPNMGDFQNNEQNIVAFDWDQDGKAEALIRAADGTTIHAADGKTYVIGDATKNYRGATGGGANWFMHDGAEYLVYINGETGVPYQTIEYPLKRLEAGETSLEAAWGDGYGHRSTKHFFGAPYLDGRKPSIFLARGIYTRHKMIALDVDPATHELKERWRWNCNTPGSPWYGQGYHNYGIADVDWDGRDEICFGSMVIDDNGHGLSTSGFGHGDAQHHGDFDPYTKGQEIFTCIEDAPVYGNCLRDGTTAKIYYKYTATADDGRSMMANFSNDYPGAIGTSSRDPGVIGAVYRNVIPGAAKNGMTQNMRIYWDGDLLDESFDYTNGKNTAGGIYKYGKGLIQTLTGSQTNNDTKGTPCYQGDILGDWREEVVMRTRDNKIRIYTTTIPTEHRNYTLWHDMQYRNAMVWQMCGYNQPPHVSYFVGELEGITQAPPALTMTERQEIGNGGELDLNERLNPDYTILCETNDMTVSVQDGYTTPVLIDNAPSWVQGHDDNNNITREYYTHTLTGGAFTGSMRLVKQGDGTLVLPNVTQTYTGPTDVWAGKLSFDGTMQKSRVWLNRFAELHSKGGKFMNGIKMDYASVLRPTGKVETDSLLLGFGARVVFGISGTEADCVKANVLTIEKKDWQYGPKYSAPVFEILSESALAEGKYLLMDAAKIEGCVEDIVLEGVDGVKAKLVNEDGKIYLSVSALRQAAKVAWDGSADGIWDFAETENFLLADGTKDLFVTGDEVTFGDDAQQTAVNVSEDVSPASLVFTNSEKDYTLSGDGSIIGEATLTKEGTGNLTIKNTNKMTGDVTINEGTLTVSALANSDGAEYGNLGGTATPIIMNGGTLAVPNTVVTTQPITVSEDDGTISVASGTLTANGNISGTKKSALHKTGIGTLAIGGTAKIGALYIDQGRVQGSEKGNVHQYPDTVVINGGTLKDPDDIYSYSSNSTTIVVPEGAKGTWTLDARCDYKGKLLGKGELTVNVTSVRSNMTGDWSQFAGTINFQNTKTGSYDPSLQWNNTYGLGNATVKGTFENAGKDVTIGRIAEKVSITGNGRTTVKKLELKVSKSRSGIIVPAVEIAGALIVSEAITITHSGYDFKVGDRVTLWKAKSLQTTSNTVVTLPELPEGLYWDTSGLLKAEGVLKVTNEPTGIKAIGNGQLTTDDSIYDLRGRKMPDGVTLPKGIYIKNGKKIVIK